MKDRREGYESPKDVGGLTFSGNLKSFWGPVLKCRGSRKHRFFRISTGARSYDLRNFGARTFNLDTNNVVKFRFSGGQTRTTEATVPTVLTILFFCGGRGRP